MSDKKRKAEENIVENEDKKQKTTINFLGGVRILILQAGIGKARCDIFTKQVLSNGGVIHKQIETDTTHIVVDEKMEPDRMCRIMKLTSPPECTVVKSVWLSSCIREKRKIDSENYVLKFPCPKDKIENAKNDESDKSDVKDTSQSHDPTPSTSDHKQNIPKIGHMYKYKTPKPNQEGESDIESDYVASDDDEGKSGDVTSETSGIGSGTSTPSISPRKLPTGSWVCAHSSSNERVNHNKHITDKLEGLAKIYENTKDRWRALGYTKAIAAVKRYPKEIKTFEEAKAIRGVGEKLANKVWEIIESGELRKLNELSSTEENKALELFMGIWGAGATTAQNWVRMGLRTLDDVKEKANLTRVQKIGLQYYDELLDRMSWEEAGKIQSVVEEAALSIQPNLIAIACGSYRRKKATCGDVDVLITHPDGKSHKGIFHKVLNKLKETGFLTDDLVSQEENGNQKKYMGVCKLPGENTKHRRLDIIVVPYDEFACALMYFTGSAHFNRSMRHLAGKMGMSLSEHSLNTGVVRKGGEKLNKGTPLPTPTEESVFQHLGLAYRPPEERNH